MKTRSHRLPIGLLFGDVVLVPLRAYCQDCPHVVFIPADDLVDVDLICCGRNDIRASNLDPLAGQGVRFTSHIAYGAECARTRATVLTGRYQQRCNPHAGNPRKQTDMKDQWLQELQRLTSVNHKWEATVRRNYHGRPDGRRFDIAAVASVQLGRPYCRSAES